MFRIKLLSSSCLQILPCFFKTKQKKKTKRQLHNKDAFINVIIIVYHIMEPKDAFRNSVKSIMITSFVESSRKRFKGVFDAFHQYVSLLKWTLKILTSVWTYSYFLAIKIFNEPASDLFLITTDVSNTDSPS